MRHFFIINPLGLDPHQSLIFNRVYFKRRPFMKKYAFLILALNLISFNSHALIELRAGYGIQTPAEDTYQALTVDSMSGFNLDAIISPPPVPFGFGLRYESMGFDMTALGATLESDMKRLSLIINYRLIDLFAYLGFIGTIGFSNDVSIASPAGNLEYDADFTTSIGVEGGVSLGLISIGAELGYMMADFEAKNSVNSDLNLDGVYAKALVGVGF